MQGKKRFSFELNYVTTKEITEDDVAVRVMNSLKHDDEDGWCVVSPAVAAPSPDLEAEAEDEAYKLYPEGNPYNLFELYEDEYMEKRREAYLTAARRYTSIIKELKREVEFLKDTLHQDQTGLAAGLAKVNKITQGYRWVTEGRGPYEWNDDKYKEEMTNMLDNIQQAAWDALTNSGKLAHSVCCEKEAREVTMEGIGYVKQSLHEELKAENERLREALNRIRDKCYSMGIPYEFYKDNESACLMAIVLNEIGSAAINALKPKQ